MGVWGTDIFENDDALNWVNELEKSQDLSTITTTLNSIVDSSVNYLEAPDCSAALATAEVVAALSGSPRSSLPDEIIQWLRVHQSVNMDTVSKAMQAISAILLDSELKELWEEADQFEEWKAKVTDLLCRLTLESRQGSSK